MRPHVACHMTPPSICLNPPSPGAAWEQRVHLASSLPPGVSLSLPLLALHSLIPHYLATHTRSATPTGTTHPRRHIPGAYMQPLRNYEQLLSEHANSPLSVSTLSHPSLSPFSLSRSHSLAEQANTRVKTPLPNSVPHRLLSLTSRSYCSCMFLYISNCLFPCCSVAV